MMIKTNILHSIGGKKAWSALLVVLPLCLFLASCVDEDEYADNPKGNLEALWHIMHEHYCFFGEKNIDWNAIYEKYRVRVDDGMTELQLFEVLSSMLGELRDGHVNLYTSFDYGRNWSWHEDYPSNFSDTLQRRYLGTDYKIATGMRYRILDDNVGYIYLGSFSGTMGAGNLDDIMSYFLTCNGLILDIRDNSGGLVTSAEELAARFTNTEIPVGYLQHKTGKGHNDFSDMEEQRLKPSKGIRWQKGVQRCQRVCEVYEAVSQRHRGGRPYGWRSRTSLLEFAAQRLGGALLCLPDVRRKQTKHRAWHRPRRECAALAG